MKCHPESVFVLERSNCKVSENLDVTVRSTTLFVVILDIGSCSSFRTLNDIIKAM